MGLRRLHMAVIVFVRYHLKSREMTKLSTFFTKVCYKARETEPAKYKLEASQRKVKET